MMIEHPFPRIIINPMQINIISAIIVYNLMTSAALLFVIWKNPRFMMGDYPEEITAGLSPQSPEEKKGARTYGLPFLLSLMLLPFFYGLLGKFSASLPFLKNATNIFILLFSFNLVDLLIIDWIVFCTITPHFLVLPGTEGHPGYKNYRFHLDASFKGTLYALCASFLFASMIELAYFLL